MATPCSLRSRVFSWELVLGILLLCLQRIQGDIDLYIRRDSLYNDLRLSFKSDLYLIKDGIPGYLFDSPKGLRSLLSPLVPSMQSVALTWFANPRNALYNIDITSSDTSIMPHPRLTISKSGKIYHSDSDFKVFFPCSGDKSGTVDIMFYLNYTDIELGQVQSKNTKSLRFSIRRECSSSLDDGLQCAHCKDKLQLLIYVVVGVAALCILLAVILFTCGFYLGKKFKQKKDADQEQEISTSTDNVSEIRPNRAVRVIKPNHNSLKQNHNLSPPRKANGHVVTHRSKHNPKSGAEVSSRIQNFTSITESVGEEEEDETDSLMSKGPNSNSEDNELKQIKEPNYAVLKTEWNKKFDHLVLHPGRVKTTKDVLGTGSYSCVYRGVARLHPMEPYKDEVAVKCLRDKSDSHLMECLTSEAILMRDLAHSNVIRLLGVFIPPKQPLHLVLQYTKHGNLHSYLTQFRESTELLDFKLLLQFAQQIAKGMEFIASKHIIHRNLQATNCLVHKDKTIKISDFALARHIGCPRIATSKLPKPFPVKWTALEGLTDEKFSDRSDVWSYGVTIWEIFTHALDPYKDIADCDIPEHLTSGNRLPQPEECPDNLFNIMSKCWLVDAKQRPSFALLTKRLKSFEASLTPKEEASSASSCSSETDSLQKNGSVVTEVERESTC